MKIKNKYQQAKVELCQTQAQRRETGNLVLINRNRNVF
jgi:hypothetical protein